MTGKQELRTLAKQIRAELDMEALSKDLAKKLVQTEEYKSANKIMLFYPLKDEVNLLSLLEDKTKTFYLPKIDGENLLCCPFNSNTELCESCFKTKEPASEPDGEAVPDLIIVPALAVDKNNYRLGYGKGFYDRFLSKINTKTIVCIPQKLIVETVCPDDYDISVDIVISA